MDGKSSLQSNILLYNEVFLRESIMESSVYFYRSIHSMKLDWDGFYLNVGQIGINIDVEWREPVDEFSPSDWTASDTAMMFNLGWFSDPIFGGDGYPAIMRDTVCRRNKKARECRLPIFTDEEKDELNGLCDF